MTEETEDKKYEYMNPSDTTSDYVKHVMAMKLMEGQPENKSFAVPKEGYNFSLLKDIASEASKGKLAYVVIEHDTAYEVQRLPDGADVKLFYKYYMAKPPTSNDRSAILKNVIMEYKNMPFEKAVAYDKKLTIDIKDKNIIPYGYIQRRCIGIAAFRKTTDPTQTLKDTINDLINEAFLSIIPKEQAKEMFNRGCELYKI